jgi:hypothetical protein
MNKDREAKAASVSGQQPEESPPADVAAAAAKLNDVAWRHFPQFEETFKGEGGLQQICQKIERTCKELDQTIQSGSAREKARAKAAMQAYGLTMELLRQIRDLKEKQEAGSKR